MVEWEDIIEDPIEGEDVEVDTAIRVASECNGLYSDNNMSFFRPEIGEITIDSTEEGNDITDDEKNDTKLDEADLRAIEVLDSGSGDLQREPGGRDVHLLGGTGHRGTLCRGHPRAAI